MGGELQPKSSNFANIYLIPYLTLKNVNPDSNAINYDLVQSQTFDWLRFPLAIAVVFIHSFGEPSNISLNEIHSDPFSSENVYNLLRISISHVLTHVAVPIFFLISGYLFFHKIKNWGKNAYVTKIKSRFKSLVIPYICWNLIAISIVLLPDIIGYFFFERPLNIGEFIEYGGGWHLFWDCHQWAHDRINWIGIATPMTAPYDLPLWFLRDLIVVVGITPLIHIYVKHTRHYGLFLLMLAYMSGVWPNISGLNITAVFFFTIGAYFSINGHNIVERFSHVRTLSYISAIILLIPLTLYDGRNTDVGYMLYPLFIISGVCATINLASQLLSKRRIRVIPLLAKSSFFIFASHTIVILNLSSSITGSVLGRGNIVIMTARYFATPLLAVAICVALYTFTSRFMPQISKVINGNR